ncbi:hypothetical protein GCM10010532_024930 [Dactylosporangium siamense]|uniref:Uncharacterized protein n=1 Tax=Dactylosporangium siamense TaxID=685454 RepID=A0A919UD67_9ACTN|nr:hypothetical protein Dsi01nite_091730 [Dactylosporangium siamense]
MAKTLGRIAMDELGDHRRVGLLHPGHIGRCVETELTVATSFSVGCWATCREVRVADQGIRKLLGDLVESGPGQRRSPRHRERRRQRHATYPARCGNYYQYPEAFGEA